MCKFLTSVFVSLGYMYPGVRELGQTVFLLFILRTRQTAFPGAAPLHTRVSNARHFRLSASWTTSATFHLFYYIHPGGYEKVPHCGFDLHFPNDLTTLSLFLCIFGYLHIYTCIKLIYVLICWYYIHTRFLSECELQTFSSTLGGVLSLAV